jgi:hypothetical protein
MTVVTLTPSEYAALLRVYDCVQAPVAIGGYLYAVIRGAGDENIYRVACV